MLLLLLFAMSWATGTDITASISTASENFRDLIYDGFWVLWVRLLLSSSFLISADAAIVSVVFKARRERLEIFFLRAAPCLERIEIFLVR